MTPEQELRRECLTKAIDMALSENYGSSNELEGIIVAADAMFNFVWEKKIYEEA